MSGIAGYIPKGKKPTKKDITAMEKRISHRGIDGKAFYIDDNIALAVNELKTTNLKAETDISESNDKNIICILDGNIYNRDDLIKELEKKKYKLKTKRDAEIIANLYVEYGIDLVNKLRGMFAFTIYNKKEKSLFSAIDKWGIKPYYYYLNDGNFMFASELKAFLDNPYFKKEFNGDILSAYLCFNSVPTKETFMKNVKRLQPGERLIFKDGKVKTEKYFIMEFTQEKKEFNEYVNNINKAVKDSVKLQFKSEVPMGSLLSSGVDSSYIVSIAKPKKTFTVGYKEQKYSEVTYAKELSDILGIENISNIVSEKDYLKNYYKLIYHMDEPLADPATIALYSIFKLAKDHVKVITSGEGADELFCGYGTYQEELNQAWYMKIPYPIRHLISNIASIVPEARGFNFLYRRGKKLEDYNIGMGRIFRDEEALKIVKLKNQINTKDIVKPYYEHYKNNTNLVKRQVIDYNFWLVRDFAHSIDRCTNMFNLECRMPFLDDEVYEAARILPDEVKISKEETKIVLRKAAELEIPNDSYKKKKLGFPVPLREWIRKDDLYNEIKKEFNTETANKFFDTKKINKLLDDHYNNKKDNYKKVWTIYTFLVWYKVYFENVDF